MRSYKILAFWFLSVLSTVAGSDRKNYDIVGLGSAFIDYIMRVNEDELSGMKCSKGSSGIIEYSSLRSLIQEHNQKMISKPGGSSANVVKGLARLGQKCAVFGKIGSDEHTHFYLKSLERLDITPLLHQGALPMGQAICFITPDGQSTTRIYQGSSHDLSEVDLDPTVFEKIRLFHMEGYQLQSLPFVEKALNLACKNGAKVSIDLSSVATVKCYKDILLNILPKYIDIIFANEEEAFELTHLSPQEACDFLATMCEVAVVTMGDKGSWVKKGNIKFYTPAFPVKVADPTGAGDLFASGFLHAYLHEASLPMCAQLGSYIASKVVQHYGSEIPEEEWKSIYDFLDAQGFNAIAVRYNKSHSQ